MFWNTFIRILDFDICCIKRYVITLELLEYSWVYFDENWLNVFG